MIRAHLLFLLPLLLSAIQEKGKYPAQSQGPKEGDAAPDFDLAALPRNEEEAKKRRTVKLSSFRDKKPVVLIFGSYT